MSRPELGFIFAAIGALSLCALSPAAPAEELVLKVVSSDAMLTPGASRCSPEKTLSCEDTLTHVFSTIQSTDWRRSLGRRFDVVRIVVSPGVYRLSDPVVIHWGWDTTTGVALEVTGPERRNSAGRAILSGARLVDSPARGGESGPNPRSAHRLQVFDLSTWPAFSVRPPAGFASPIAPVATELFLGDTALPLAHWPNRGYGRLDRPSGIDPSDRSTFIVSGRDARDWEQERELEAFAYWFYDWADETLHISLTREGALKIDGKLPQYGIRPGQRIRIENAFSELDEAGEWYLDRVAMKLYVWPPAGQTSSGMELSMTPELLRVENSRRVKIQNIEMEKTRGDAVVVLSSEDVEFDGVSIRYTGNRALVIKGGERCGIRDSLIEHNGEGGIVLSGGDRKTLTSSSHFAERNTIRDFSRLSKTYRPAVEMDGVGQLAIGNTISQGPHSAILFKGNNHRIAGNDIFDVVRETSDAGAIYTERDYTARGTIIEDNFIHDIQPYASGRDVKGIYLDDMVSGITMRRNIFARVQQPVYIGGGRDNLIDGNIFYKSSPAIHLDARGLRWRRDAVLDPKGELQRRLDAVPYRSTIYKTQYPNLAKIRDDDMGAPKYNVARDNVVVGGKPAEIEPAALEGLDLGRLTEQSEEVFAEPAPVGGRKKRSDFKLK